MSFIFGHRGSSGEYPENTMLAFEKAIEQDCDGIELDIHLTKDQKLIVCHDFTLDRTTNGSGYIKNFTMEELQTLDAGSWKNPSFSHCYLPSLEEVFDLIRGTELLLNIEFKAGSVEYPHIEEKVIELINTYKIKDQCLLSSFDHYCLLRLRSLDLEIYTGVLHQCSMVDSWLYADKLKANALHPYYITITEEVVKQCSQYGKDINTYTVNKLDDAIKLSKAGVNAIITDYPQMKKEIIKV
ncbi:glycerophosphodiester phosphodiesterase [Vallitalea okinawensis]|uniref:glycerophosphodiester phosphodiesterase n=1 Tax=Vallitalea okinawensis TaxID=2078660 RepID=UPI000CFD7D12|nr:glycerophosphodiester phosphodiesterase [Vallitalea okinawensis]